MYSLTTAIWGECSTGEAIYRIIHYRLKIADLVAETLDERLEEGIERRKQEKKKRQGLFGKLFG